MSSRKSYSLGITESQYRGEGGTRVPSRPSAAGLVSQSATDRDDELRNHVELIAAVPFAWGWGLTWIDIGLAVFFYLLCRLGVTAGFHRYFTHRAFKANRALRIALAVAGSMAFQGSIITWVADHGRHYIFTDKEGAPHSPWLFGTSAAAVARGFWHAHPG